MMLSASQTNDTGSKQASSKLETANSLLEVFVRSLILEHGLEDRKVHLEDSLAKSIPRMGISSLHSANDTKKQPRLKSTGDSYSLDNDTTPEPYYES